MTNTTRRTKSAAGSKLGITGATVLAGASAAAKKAPAKRTARKTTSAARQADGTMNLMTGEIKMNTTQAQAKKRTAAKRTPKSFDNVPETDKAPARKTTAKKAPAKKSASNEPKQLKRDIPFEQRDWTYLDEKDPSIQQVLFAKEINMRTNIEIDAKQVQAVLAMHPYFQRSETNKKRPDYHGLDAVVVEQRSVHMKQAHADAKEIMDGLAAAALTNKPAAKKAAAKKTAPAPAKKTAARVTRKAPAKKAEAAF